MLKSIKPQVWYTDKIKLIQKVGQNYTVQTSYDLDNNKQEGYL